MKEVFERTAFLAVLVPNMFRHDFTEIGVRVSTHGNNKVPMRAILEGDLFPSALFFFKKNSGLKRKRFFQFF